MKNQISVITAAFNSTATIHECIDSVRFQSICAEQIIIDGGSTDGTIDNIGNYTHISHVVSEKDKGIYDAMNKGISLASGGVIGILNSDDFYINGDVLKKVSEVLADNTLDSCYGDLQYVDKDDISKKTRDWKSGRFRSNLFLWGWMPPHPTFFVRRSIYEKYGLYNLELGTAADYELMLRFLVRHKISTTYIPEVLVKMRSGGISNRSLLHRFRANQMDLKAWDINGLKPYPWTTLLKPLRKIFQYQFFPDNFRTYLHGR